MSIDEQQAEYEQRMKNRSKHGAYIVIFGAGEIRDLAVPRPHLGRTSRFTSEPVHTRLNTAAKHRYELRLGYDD